MTFTLRQIVEKFPHLMTHIRGDISLSGINAPSQAGPDNLIFVGNQQALKEALTSRAGAWLVAEKLSSQVPANVAHLATSSNVQLAMSMVARECFPITLHHKTINGPDVHPSAHIAKSAKIGENCIIGAGAVVGEDAQIGEHTIIGSNSVIEPKVKIGPRCYIHPLVFIGHSCELGAECEIHPNTTIGSEGFGYAQDAQYRSHRITHYGRVILEDRVHIGAGVQIDRGTFLDSRIGEGTKIDNHCHFGHNIVIGKNTIITGGMIAAGSATIGSYCVFGGRTTMAGHISVADKTQVSGLSGISKSITKSGEYGGFPLQDLRSTLKTRVALRQLPKLISQVKQIMKHLGIKDLELTSDNES